MEEDISKIFYEKYFGTKNQEIEILLKNGETIRGYVVGFFHGNDDRNEPFIIRLHVSPISENLFPGTDFLGNPTGYYIETKNIKQIKSIS